MHGGLRGGGLALTKDGAKAASPARWRNETRWRRRPSTKMAARDPGRSGKGMEEPGGSRFAPPPPWERPGPPPPPAAGAGGGGAELEYVDLDEFLREHGLPPPSPPATPERPPAPGPPRAPPEAPLEPEALGGGPGAPPFDPRRLRFSQEELRPQPIARKARKVHVPDEQKEELRPQPIARKARKVHVPDEQKEELRPQPIARKAHKVHVPDEQKDEKYWSRRSRNNAAAKRSRDARRLKENQISVRAAFLERENAALRLEVAAARRELQRFRGLLARYEARHGQI